MGPVPVSQNRRPSGGILSPFPKSVKRDLSPFYDRCMRLDVWLDVSCLFKTRSEAKRACEGGKVEVNGDHAKPNRFIREGDRVRIRRGAGLFQDVIVRIILEQHVKKAEARALYDDVTPKPSPQEVEMR